jgi:hypothetical protein
MVWSHLVIIGVVVALAVWIWPSQKVAMPIRETILSVAQGQPVGDEAYFRGFLLNTGWHMAEAPPYGRYTLVAEVTNEQMVRDVAHVMLTIHVGERLYTQLCEATLNPNETKALECRDTGLASFTSRWARITLSTY